MPPKRQHSADDIAQAAFEIARRDGLANLTARAVAQRLGSSTSPIYSAFNNMEDLAELVCERSTRLMLTYQMESRSGSPMLDLCLGYLIFADEEKQLFRDMFLNKTSLTPHSMGMKNYAFGELAEKMVLKDPDLAHLTPEQALQVLEILWTYTHGLAAQVNIGARVFSDHKEAADHLATVLEPLLARFTSSER